MLQPAAPDELEVESTTTAPTDPSFYIYEAWCPMTEMQKTETLQDMNDVTGIVYLNTTLEFRSVSIISKPAHRPHQTEWRLGQIGTRLSQGPEGILFNLNNVCGSIVVPMRESNAKRLGLLYDSTKIISAANCKLWDDFNLENDLPGEGELRMAILPCVFPYEKNKAQKYHSHSRTFSKLSNHQMVHPKY